MRGPLFPKHIQIRVEPELRAAVEEAARADKTTASEFLRRELRSALQARRPKSAERLASADA